MNKERLLEVWNALNVLEERCLGIAEEISSVKEVVYAIMEDEDKETPASGLPETKEKTTANGKVKKGPHTLQRKNINNINKTRSVLYNTKSIPISCDQIKNDLKSDQKNKKSTLPSLYFEIQEDIDGGAGESVIQGQWVDYARKKGVKANLVPIFTDFVLYHSKNNSKFANWYAAWQTWVRNQIKFTPECTNHMGTQKRLTKDDLGDIFEN